MKKLLVSLVAAVLMALGFVGVSSGPAHATCPYQTCIKTKTVVTSGPTSVDKGASPSYEVKVKPKAGSGTTDGTVTITCTRPGFPDKVGTGTLSGGTATIKMPKFRAKGTWSCTVTFGRQGPFLGSHTSFDLTVG